MSLTTTIDVVCDVCANWTHGDTGRTASKRDARITACAEGGFGRFKRDGVLVDVCPGCQTPEERERRVKQATALRALQAEADAANGITYVGIHELSRRPMEEAPEQLDGSWPSG